MDLVLVGLPGSGKSVVGRRIAHRHDAAFIDLDETIERRAGHSIATIFETEGETGFRAREAEAVAELGPADPEAALRRVIATGGGTVVDPRNRWRLNQDRLVVWLDARPEALAQRLRHSRTVRPLVSGRDAIGAVRDLAAARERFYATAARVNALAEPSGVAGAIESLIAVGRPVGGTRVLDAETRIGRFVIGDGIAVAGVAQALDRLEARRAILVSEPAAWAAAGLALADGLRSRGLAVEYVELPSGEAAKRLSVVEEAGRALARLRVERSEPIVAIGGGGLGDTAGLLAALWQRGIPLIHVPTTLVAQIDSAIGGKTAVDLPEGKNLLGAFHQPAAVIVDIAFLRSLPERQRRSALGEAVKMAALGDERLFGLLERDGDAIARGDDAAFESGAVAELVERAMWAKVEVVLADEREQGAVMGAPSGRSMPRGGLGGGLGGRAGGTGGGPGRFALNLGHSAGHAFEAAGHYESLLHGEAVAFGLRVASRLGVGLGVTPPQRADRVGTLLTDLGLGTGRLPFAIDEVIEALSADKKHAAGRLRWVLPTASGVELRTDVPDALVRATLEEMLEP
jgi:shikimate kinase / 3-dehydroquinate synthase